LDLHCGKTCNLLSEDALFEFSSGNGFPQFVLLLIPFRQMSTHLIRHRLIPAAEGLHVFTDGNVVSHGEMELLIENQHSFLGINILKICEGKEFICVQTRYSIGGRVTR
jgi:hypothetical protein